MQNARLFSWFSDVHIGKRKKKERKREVVYPGFVQSTMQRVGCSIVVDLTVYKLRKRITSLKVSLLKKFRVSEKTYRTKASTLCVESVRPG